MSSAENAPVIAAAGSRRVARRLGMSLGDPQAQRAMRRLLTLLPWALAAVFLGRNLVHHIQSMPIGRYAWNDSYVYAGSASDFLSRPSQLYQAAGVQLNGSVARRSFIYPPSGLIPFLPMVPVTRGYGLATAASIWSAVDLGALLAAVAVFGRMVRLSWGALGLAAMFVAVCGPILIETNSGQVNGAVLLLLVLAWRWYPRPAAGVLLGLGLALKPICPVLLLLPLLRRQPRVTGLALVTLLAVNLPFLPFLGLDGTWFYLIHVLPNLSSVDVHDVDNFSVTSILQVWLGGRNLSPSAGAVSAVHLGWLATGLAWAARVGVLAALVVACRRRRPSDVTLFACTLATIPVFAASTWPHYFLYLLPLVLVLLANASARVRAVAGAGFVLAFWQGFDQQLWVYDPTRATDIFNRLRFAQAELIPLVALAVVVVLLLRRGRAANDGATAPRRATSARAPA